MGLKFLFKNFQSLRHVSVGWLGWLGWLGRWFFELVVLFQSAFFLVGFLFRVDWSSWMGSKFLLENFQFLPQVFSWLGWLGCWIFELVVFFS